MVFTALNEIRRLTCWKLMTRPGDLGGRVQTLYYQFRLSDPDFSICLYKSQSSDLM